MTPLDYCKGFGWINRKIEEAIKILAMSGVLRRGVGTHTTAKVHAMTWHAHVAAWPSGRLVKPRVRRGVPIGHAWRYLCFV